MYTPQRNSRKIYTLVEYASDISEIGKLQKIVYILNHYGLNTINNFYYNYLGPFSNDLDLEIEAMIEKGVLRTDKKKRITVNNKYRREYNDRDMSKYKKLIKKLNRYNTEQLDVLSSIYFLKDKGYESNEIEFKIKTLKPYATVLAPSVFLTYEEISKTFQFDEPAPMAACV